MDSDWEIIVDFNCALSPNEKLEEIDGKVIEIWNPFEMCFIKETLLI